MHPRNVGVSSNGSGVRWTRVLCPPARMSSIRCQRPLAIRNVVFHTNRTTAAPQPVVHDKNDPSWDVRIGLSNHRPTRRDKQLIDIVPGNLTATLEAHRASNRNGFRKIPYGDRNSDGNAEPHQLKEEITRVRRRKNSLLLRNVAPHKAWESHESMWAVGRDRLNIEIRNFAESVQPSDAEQDYRSLLASSLCYMLESGSPSDTHLEVFGSQANGLAMASSDIDLVFDVKSLRPRIARGPSTGLGKRVNRRIVQRAAWTMSTQLKNDPEFVDFTYVQARVPLLMFRHASGLGIQLVYHDPFAELVAADLAILYQAEYPQARPIFMLLKAALVGKNLLDGSIGALNSHTLFMMIVACFKIRNLSRSDDLVEALRTFLSFYHELDTTKFGIAVDPPEVFIKRDEASPLSLQAKAEINSNSVKGMQLQLAVADKDHPWKLCLQSPSKPTRDLGKNCQHFREVQEMISESHSILEAWLEGEYATGEQNESLMSRIVGEGFDRISISRREFEQYLRTTRAMKHMGKMREHMRIYNSPGYQLSYKIARCQIPIVGREESKTIKSILTRLHRLHDDLQEDMRDYRKILRDLAPIKRLDVGP